MKSPTRRTFLQGLAAAPLAAALRAEAANAPPGPLLVLVFLWGGNDAYNTFIPYTDPLYARVRPDIAIARDAVLKVTDHHGFHPSLAPLVPVWDARELALVQGLGYPGCTQQHYRDGDTAFTGCDGQDYSTDGWVTKALAYRARKDREDAIAFDVLDVRAADPMGPFRGDKLGAVQVYYGADLLNKRRLSECVFEANARGQAALATTPDLPPTPLKTSFPTDPFGQAMRAAVELADHDLDLPVIHVALNGLDEEKHHSVDCHWNQLEWHGAALSRLANGLAALRAGLIEIGRWDDTLVVTYDEFGRCPTQNDDKGTHHGHATTHFVMGGKVKGGLIGEAPRVADMFPKIGGPAPTIDTRRLWTTVIERFWKADAANVFPQRHQAIEGLLKA